MVDSGNNLNVFPKEVADSINAAFDPPAGGYNAKAQAPVVDCNATAPALSVEIGNAIFDIDPVDMIWRDAHGTCFSSVVSTDSVEGETIKINFLGDVFLKNVVAVFDMEHDEMRFAQRLGDDKTTS